MTDRVALARAQLAWPTVARGHPDEQALDVLAAVLGQISKENRLYRTLVFDKQIAIQAAAFSYNSDLSGTFNVSITARQGQSLDGLVALADEQIEHLKADGPTEDEVRKAKNGEEAQLVFGLQSATRSGRLPQRQQRRVR